VHFVDCDIIHMLHILLFLQ